MLPFILFSLCNTSTHSILPPTVLRRAKPDILHFTHGPGHIQSQRSRGWVSNTLDFMLLFFMFALVKPASYFLIYMELLLLAGVFCGIC